MYLGFLDRLQSFGLLLLRIGIGASFVVHGGTKLIAGPEVWEGLGSAMAYYGVTTLPVVWGFAAGFVEFTGGVALICGFWFRPYCLILAFTMFTAFEYHLQSGDTFTQFSHPIELFTLFVSLFFIGPGSLSIDHERSRSRRTSRELRRKEKEEAKRLAAEEKQKKKDEAKKAAETKKSEQAAKGQESSK